MTTNTHTTSNPTTLRNLGLNPGLVDNYSDVSERPISFTNLGPGGRGTRWEAVHSGVDDMSGRKITIDGAEFSAKSSVRSYKGLLEIWFMRDD